MNQVLIASVRKKRKFEDNSFWHGGTQFVSFDRDKLKQYLEKHYGINLIKDENNDFPYFTDGGFKYSAENDNYLFDIEAHLHNIIE